MIAQSSGTALRCSRQLAADDLFCFARSAKCFRDTCDSHGSSSAAGNVWDRFSMLEAPQVSD